MTMERGWPPPFAFVLPTSVVGTFRTQRVVRFESVMRGKADIGGADLSFLFKEAEWNHGRPNRFGESELLLMST
jgi:hypothetical protein